MKSLQKWIQENAKSGEQAWQMFWDAFQQQQKGLGNWDENDPKKIEHHQSTAYWWFGQAFQGTKFHTEDPSKKGKNSDGLSTIKKEASAAIKVKQEAKEAAQTERSNKRSHDTRNLEAETTIANKKIKQQASLDESSLEKMKRKEAKKKRKNNPDSTNPEAAGINSKLKSLASLLHGARKTEDKTRSSNQVEESRRQESLQSQPQNVQNIPQGLPTNGLPGIFSGALPGGIPGIPPPDVNPLLHAHALAAAQAGFGMPNPYGQAFGLPGLTPEQVGLGVENVCSNRTKGSFER